jgi:hypothetical protein
MTPLDDAERHGHQGIVEIIRNKRGGHGQRPSGAPATIQLSPLWVAPNALLKCLSGKITDELKMNERAQGMAARALDSWNNDVIALQAASGGHAFLFIGEALLNRHDLVAHFQLDRQTVRRFLLAAEAAYAIEGSEKKYHNSVHGADVALTTHLFLSKFGQLERLTKVQLLAVVLAALMHDFNHPGTTNAHEVCFRPPSSLCPHEASWTHPPPPPPPPLPNRLVLTSPQHTSWRSASPHPNKVLPGKHLL